MAESYLDPYREDIVTLVLQGKQQAEIMRELKQRYGVDVRRSTLSDYIKALSDAAGGGAASHGQGIPQDVQEAALMRSAGAEILDQMAQVIEGVQQLKREGDETYPKLRETLERHTLAFENLYGAFRGAVLCNIWLRALVYTGVGWGVVAAAAYGYFWGSPF